MKLAALSQYHKLSALTSVKQKTILQVEQQDFWQKLSIQKYLVNHSSSQAQNNALQQINWDVTQGSNHLPNSRNCFWQFQELAVMIENNFPVKPQFVRSNWRRERQISEANHTFVSARQLTCEGQPVLSVQVRINLVKEVEGSRIRLLHGQNEGECHHRLLPSREGTHPLERPTLAKSGLQSNSSYLTTLSSSQH